jgi:putative CocE/NonD family hydrolase
LSADLSAEGAGWIDCGDGVRLERGVVCRMSDGVRLISDHYYAAGSPAVAQPTLLMRQPYGRDIASTVVYAHPVWFARQGYNVVIQDVRGRGDSEGEFYPFRHERKDGAETIAWLVTRPECNGKIGMYGFSYQGLTQLLAAAEQPEGLVCIAPAMTACDLYRGWFYHNGALRLAATMSWGLQLLRFDARRLGLKDAHAALEMAWQSSRAQALFAPYAELPAVQGAGLPTYVKDWFEHAEAETDSNTEAYWAGHDVSRALDRIAIPALHVAGWYDTYLQGSWDGYRALREGAGREGAGSVEARENQFLVVGPWQHIPWGSRTGEGSFGPDAAVDTDAILLRWFNHWLKGTGEFAGEARVRHFAMGAGRRWCGSRDAGGAERRTLYLGSGGRANSAKGDGVLGDGSGGSADTFVYDPEVPVVAPGGITAASGLFDQGVMEQGNNLLVYTSEVLTEAVHVFGSPELVVYCTTSAGSADVTGKLVRVTPEGRAEFVCIGIARSGFLFAEYAADTMYEWRFLLEPTSCVFGVGDRIRLEVAGGAFPLYDRNSSNETPAREASPWSWGRSTHRVWHDGERPSRLVLPLFDDADGDGV